MRKVSRGVLAVLLAAGLSGVSGTAHAAPTRADQDVLARLKKIPGMTVQEKTSTLTGYRFFVLNYRQPVDHRHPAKGTFEQRITLLHKADRPARRSSTPAATTSPRRRAAVEPTQIVDGNQVSMEYRFFTPSRPAARRLDEAATSGRRPATSTALQGAQDDLRTEVALHGRRARAA